MYAASIMWTNLSSQPDLKREESTYEEQSYDRACLPRHETQSTF